MVNQQVIATKNRYQQHRFLSQILWLQWHIFSFNMTAHIVSDGQVAEWLCRGLQILVCRFDSDPGLQFFPL